MGDTQGMVHSEANCSLFLSVALPSVQNLKLDPGFLLTSLPSRPTGIGGAGEGWVLPFRPSGLAVLFPFLCLATPGPPGFQAALPQGGCVPGHTPEGVLCGGSISAALCYLGLLWRLPQAGISCWWCLQFWWSLPYGPLWVSFMSIAPTWGLCPYDIITSPRPLLIPSHYTVGFNIRIWGGGT